MAERHEHLHLFGDGLRALVHAHPDPGDAGEGSALRPHRHVNGRHSHPHGHGGYQLLPPDNDRRPIVAANG